MMGLLSLAGATAARAEDVVQAQLILSNHTFDPAELNVPAGKKVKLTVINKDATSAEFESDDLNREKVIAPNGQIFVYIGPLDAGSYGYYDDFHRSTTTGKIIAK